MGVPFREKIAAILVLQCSPPVLFTMKTPTSLEDLIESLRCLPGVGPKSAQRMAHGRVLLVAAMLVTSLTAATAHAQTTAPPAPSAQRPRVGVALGGGSARGLAHVGVLRWLEEHHIPIDVLAERLGSTRGAIYKTLHDARAKLRRALTDAGYAEQRND